MWSWVATSVLRIGTGNAHSGRVSFLIVSERAPLRAMPRLPRHRYGRRTPVAAHGLRSARPSALATAAVGVLPVHVSLAALISYIVVYLVLLTRN